MDIDTLKTMYFNYHHKKTNDIIELYNFYKEYTQESKPMTFRSSFNQNACSSQNLGRLSNSAMKKHKESPKIQKNCSKDQETKNLSKQLKKIYNKENENPQKNKVFLSIQNKNLFNQKLNFIDMVPTTKNSKPPRPNSVKNSTNRNSKSTEKIIKKEKISNNSFGGGIDSVSNASLEKNKNFESCPQDQKQLIDVERMISPNNRKKENIFACLPLDTQQQILNNQTRMADIEKIRNISKVFKNYRAIKSEIPVKIMEQKKKLNENDSRFLNLVESFLEKSCLENRPLKNERLINRNEEEFDEKSFLEGLKQAAAYNNFQGKDISHISNDPSFLLPN